MWKLVVFYLVEVTRWVVVERTGGCLRCWEPPKTQGGKWGRRCFSSKLWILWWLSTSSFQVPSLKCIGFGRVPGVCEAKLTLWHGGLKMQIQVRQFGRGRSWFMEEDPNKIDGWHNTQERERERGREMDLCIPLLHKHHTTCPYHIIFITSFPHQFVHSI